MIGEIDLNDFEEVVPKAGSGRKSTEWAKYGERNLFITATLAKRLTKISGYWTVAEDIKNQRLLLSPVSEGTPNARAIKNSGHRVTYARNWIHVTLSLPQVRYYVTDELKNGVFVLGKTKRKAKR